MCSNSALSPNSRRGYSVGRFMIDGGRRGEIDDIGGGRRRLRRSVLVFNATAPSIHLVVLLEDLVLLESCMLKQCYPVMECRRESLCALDSDGADHRHCGTGRQPNELIHPTLHQPENSRTAASVQRLRRTRRAKCVGSRSHGMEPYQSLTRRLDVQQPITTLSISTTQ